MRTVDPRWNRCIRRIDSVAHVRHDRVTSVRACCWPQRQSQPHLRKQRALLTLLAPLVLHRTHRYETGPSETLEEDISRALQETGSPSWVVFFSPSAVKIALPTLQVCTWSSTN